MHNAGVRAVFQITDLSIAQSEFALLRIRNKGVMDILRGIFWIHCSSGHFMWCLFYSLLARNLFLFIFDLPI